jgi:uncharacterized protein YprB with RNaseH-like and TPR domain
MVRGAFLHLPGIGAIRAARLRALGVRDWSEFGPQPPAGLRLGPASWSALLDEVARCDQALAGGDLGFLAGALRGPDLWRLLAVYSERAAFVDIETDGLHHGARITVIACLWQGRLHTFVQDENLDEFLDLLQHVELLVTFNGASFDIPMIRNGFHIPELPCAHVDLRWVCYHAGWRGGLKAVEGQLGLQRPGDLLGVDGAAAVDLWTCWEQQRSRPHRDLLVRYCAADTVALRGVAGALLKHYGCPCAWPAGDAVWHDLNEALPAPAAAPLRWASTVAAGARAAKPNEDVSGIASTASPPGPGVTPSPAPGSPRPTCIPRPANTQSAARRRLRELLQRRFAGRRE